MELILTGKNISAQEAFDWGVVSRVVADDELFDFAIETAKQISSYSKPVVLMAKEAINAGMFLVITLALNHWGQRCYSLSAEETTLSQGLL